MMSKMSFFSHVFSTTEESKAEISNIVQYSILGVIPIVIMNKLIQRFIPEADGEKSSLELLVEISLQIVIMFCGIIVIHRIITYVPTYSGFKYESLTLTNSILAFLVITLSIQSKLGIKVNILYDRVLELWNGNSADQYVKKGTKVKNNVRVMDAQHVPSQADQLDEQPTGIFPPMPRGGNSDTNNGRGNEKEDPYYGMMSMGPQPANGVLGGSFGASF